MLKAFILNHTNSFLDVNGYSTSDSLYFNNVSRKLSGGLFMHFPTTFHIFYLEGETEIYVAEFLDEIFIFFKMDARLG